MQFEIYRASVLNRAVWETVCVAHETWIFSEKVLGNPAMRKVRMVFALPPVFGLPLSDDKSGVISEGKSSTGT
jgi:hypothetical protein